MKPGWVDFNMKCFSDAGKVLIPDDYFPELSFEARQLRWVKEQFQKFYLDKKEELFFESGTGGFLSSQRLNELFGTAEFDELIDLVMDLNSVMYQYIKVE